MVQDAVGKGATVATGGSRVGNKGYFFEPTVVADAHVVPVGAQRRQHAEMIACPDRHTADDGRRVIGGESGADSRVILQVGQNDHQKTGFSR